MKMLISVLIWMLYSDVTESVITNGHYTTKSECIELKNSAANYAYIERATARSKLHCSMMCETLPSCLAYNVGPVINQDGVTCELLEEKISSCADLEYRLKFSYYEHTTRQPQTTMTTPAIPVTTTSTTMTAPTTTEYIYVNPCTSLPFDVITGSVQDGTKVYPTGDNKKLYMFSVNADGTINSDGVYDSNTWSYYNGPIDDYHMREFGNFNNAEDASDVHIFLAGANTVHCMNYYYQVDSGSRCSEFPNTVEWLYGTGAPDYIEAILEYSGTRTYLFKGEKVYISDRPDWNSMQGMITDQFSLHDPHSDNIWVNIPSHITAISHTPHANMFVLFVGTEYYTYNTLTKAVVHGPECLVV